ncbi:MAG: hypothetical protein EON95_12090 [Caulobacteraceae bacterium]|nr:MAG: hypothetical protein EON95_12090 [Caulobacteraceae bacterium]
MWHRIAFKALAATAIAASLSACNLVVTTEPTFLAEDQATPALREGLWVNQKTGCDFDLKAPATSWPECANWIVVKGSAMTGVDEKGETFSAPFVLAAGDPRVLQFRVEDDADSKQAEDGKPAAIYLYMGMRPLEFDTAGRIVAYSGWVVQCGPPPPADAKRADGNPRYGSLTPAPGMIMDDDQSGCAPESKAALIGAARLSEVYETGADKTDVSRWVRDGDK